MKSKQVIIGVVLLVVVIAIGFGYKTFTDRKEVVDTAKKGNARSWRRPNRGDAGVAV